MSISVWSIIRFIHVVSAILWVGGQLSLILVVRPATRWLPDSERTLVFVEAGKAFGRIALFGLIPVLLASGLALTWRHGVDLGGLNLSSYSVTLWTKIALALVSFALAAVHGVVALQSPTKTSRVLGMAGAAVSLTVVLLATSLVS